MRAFDMSRFQRVIATEGRIRGSFVVHSSESHGVFAIEPMEVVCYDEDRTWGQVFRPGDFEVGFVDGEPRVGRRGPNKGKHAAIHEFTPLIEETLALVVRAFNEGPGAVVEHASASADRSSRDGDHIRQPNPEEP